MDYPLPILDMDTLKRLTTIVVERQGRDFVYSNTPESYECYYVPREVSVKFTAEDNRTKSGCLIGEILKEHGVPVEVLASLNVSDNVGDVAAILAEKDILWIDPKALSVMRNMQSQQDDGDSWGSVLDYLMSE